MYILVTQNMVLLRLYEKPMSMMERRLASNLLRLKRIGDILMQKMYTLYVRQQHIEPHSI